MKVVLRYQPEPEDFAMLSQAAPAAEFVVCTDDGALAGVVADADVLIGGMSLTDAILAAAPALKWVQSTATGVENFLASGLAVRAIPLTNFRGVPAPTVADHVMALILAFARGLPELAAYQARSAWRMRAAGMIGFDLMGQRLGIVGFGAIGQALAKRARSFDMDVWAVRRTEGDDHSDVSLMLTLDRLPELLAACDHVVLALPSTPETKGLMTSKLLERMRPSTFFYNVARGDVVDQEALIAALSQGRLAGAGLDVTTPEPLPTDSPLWTMPNVIITAHTGGNSSSYSKRGTALLVENLRRYQAGEALLNIVDLKHGY